MGIATIQEIIIPDNLVCAEAVCHTGVAWTTIKLGGNVIYNGCPTNNFLTINPCTGKIKP